MSFDLTEVSNEDVYKAKLERRRKIAALPMAVKLRVLLELQQLSFNLMIKRGQKPSRPWNMTLETYEELTSNIEES